MSLYLANAVASGMVTVAVLESETTLRLAREADLLLRESLRRI